MIGEIRSMLLALTIASLVLYLCFWLLVGRGADYEKGRMYLGLFVGGLCFLFFSMHLYLLGGIGMD